MENDSSLVCNVFSHSVAQQIMGFKGFFLFALSIRDKKKEKGLKSKFHLIERDWFSICILLILTLQRT